MHLPVLLQEVVDGLAPKEGDVILDATVGGGGHSEALCKAMGGRGKFICLDADSDALRRSQERLSGCGCEFHFLQKNFRDLDAALAELRISTINRALFDLGLSSFQLEESGRGFSFQRDEPLQMTFEKIPLPSRTPFTKGRTASGALTAGEIVNEWSEARIADIIGEYGEERGAKRIARAIIQARGKKRIETTLELASLIEKVLGRRGRKHPVTKTFQALRMAVNDEIGALKEALPKAFRHLVPEGRLAVISFHSIEDRIVKNLFKTYQKEGQGRLLTRKPLVPSEDELRSNPRSRSAKLRIIEKIWRPE